MKELKFNEEMQRVIDEGNSNYANGTTKEYVSPTEVGKAYGEYNGKKRYHSSSSSPTLLKLVSLGLAERNEKGHYKSIN